MSVFWIVMTVLGLGVLGYFAGRHRAIASAGGERRQLHSLPVYYGVNVVLSTVAPALGVLCILLIAVPVYINGSVSAGLPDSAIPDGGTRGLVMAEVRRTASGLENAVASGALAPAMATDAQADPAQITTSLENAGQIITTDLTQPVLHAAQAYRAAALSARNAIAGLTVLASLIGLVLSVTRTTKDYRARNTVEQGVLGLLVLAALVAIATTVGILLSLVFNTVEFFRIYPATDFFFGTTWAPSFSGRGGQSALGVIPLIWGTIYISLLALAVAVPVGLLSAIYLSEYAGPKVRAFAKPALEILAGIPTIVYGLFALLTIGPMLMRVFGPDSVGWMSGASSVMTAGLVMGIMLIPFVSSLSDDIINAVPQSMRDGSLGLGATQSETVRFVILPAALPGIVGAILLAASRAIGETMIVVMGAGAAARLDLNPFAAMTTVTAKIVSQLTGDAEFTSPETLVAFALGMTLFVITLGMNVLALKIVRKYQEQYE